jgi:hypothetical protein
MYGGRSPARPLDAVPAIATAAASPKPAGFDGDDIASPLTPETLAAEAEGHSPRKAAHGDDPRR